MLEQRCLWRFDELGGAEVAVMKSVTLSYKEAARLMDGGEEFDTLPASCAIIERLTAFAQAYYKPELEKSAPIRKAARMFPPASACAKC